MLDQILSQGNLEIFGQLSLAVLLGAAIGMERELARKTAGMRTFALVSMGAALFSIISKFAFVEFWGVPGFDPSRIASQVVVGIGFLGAGLIILRQDKIQGLTTAAGLWVSAAIGMAVGFGLYTVAMFATILTIIILLVLWAFEHKIVKRLQYSQDELNNEDR
ncbi:MAG: MgtC/SapB family protein [bacterium]|nr:MgtC/SapB family protein [bacterium]